MDPITLIAGLVQFAPTLIKYIGGSNSKAAAVATKAISIAQAVTGAGSGSEALNVLKGNPDLAAKYAQAVLDQEVEFQKLAAQNATDINNTMQAEAKADHWPTYSWRPFIGFCVGFNTFAASVLVLGVYGCLMFGLAAVAAQALVQLPTVLGALAAINGTVLPILGIASWFRGKAQADPNIPTDMRG